mmetsp:Transcript_56840/g.138358  ORF Transcript_56840/g.138358 Transcript_56840/m.138358 type:complete len:90 (-) Transcript_56840:4362-4631(-)
MELHQLQATEDAITHEMAWKTRSIDVELVNSSGKTVKVDLTSMIKTPPLKMARVMACPTSTILCSSAILSLIVNWKTWTRQAMKHRKAE